MAETRTLEQALKGLTVEGELYEKLPGGKVKCHACGHRCTIFKGQQGICKVRFNEDGRLYVPYGYVSALQCDPIEKKPFFHAMPGSLALSFGMLGCDLHCGYCQNWVTSQALRDPVAGAPPQKVSPGDLVNLAGRHNAPVVASTYNEPLITSEWAVGVFKEAKKAGLRCAYISNGNGTPEVLEYLKPWVDYYKVDLKSFNDRHYRELGGVLDRILETVRMLVEKKFWVEIVTLIVPGFNDGNEEFKEIADFLVSVSPDIPWHVTAFHQDYKMRDRDNTTASTLIRAAEIGASAGLRYVYTGNLPGKVGEWENTRCPGCGTALVERHGFRVLANRLEKGGVCPKCKAKIAGRWEG